MSYGLAIFRSKANTKVFAVTHFRNGNGQDVQSRLGQFNSPGAEFLGAAFQPWEIHHDFSVSFPTKDDAIAARDCVVWTERNINGATPHFQIGFEI